MKNTQFKIGQKVVNTYSKGTWDNGIIIGIDNNKFDNIQIKVTIGGVERLVWQSDTLIK